MASRSPDSTRARTRDAAIARAGVAAGSNGPADAFDEGSDASSSGDERVAAFERRLAAEDDSASDLEGVIFADVTGAAANVAVRARTLEQHANTWAIVSDRWANDQQERQALSALETAIREEAAMLTCEELDEFCELSCAPSLVERPLCSGRLLVGSEEDARSERVLSSCGVDAVLCCVEEEVSPRRRAMYEERGVVHMHLPMRDELDEDLGCHLSQARRFLTERLGAGDTVLVHCFIGQNRSCAVALAYLCLDEGFDLVEAVRAVARTRGLILGSGSFQLQLVRLCCHCPYS